MEYVSSDEFQAKVLDSDVPVLVDFFANWCGPCVAMSPILEKVAERLAGKARVYKLDVDKNPDKANEYGVKAIPYLVLFKGGGKVQEVIGLTGEEDLVNMITAVL